jgi:hypothetical protein
MCIFYQNNLQGTGLSVADMKLVKRRSQFYQHELGNQSREFIINFLQHFWRSVYCNFNNLNS